MAIKQNPANQCAQCGAELIAPEWSEYLSERCVRHSWSCEMCAYQFESTVYFRARELTVDLEAA